MGRHARGRELRDLAYSFFIPTAADEQTQLRQEMARVLRAVKREQQRSSPRSPSESTASTSSSRSPRNQSASPAATAAAAAAVKRSPPAPAPASSVAAPSAPASAESQQPDSASPEHLLKLKQEEEDERIAREYAAADALALRTRTRRENVDSLLRECWSDDDLQIICFPLISNGSNRGIAAATVRPSSDPSARLLIQPSTQNLQSLWQLFRSCFSNVSGSNLVGHAAVVLFDESNFRNRRSNSRNRTGATEVEPFEAVLCGCIFDRQERFVHGEAQHILRLSYVATAERFAGRGFAKLLLSHIKVLAARLTQYTNREATLVVLSLEHTLPFWASPSMVSLQP